MNSGSLTVSVAIAAARSQRTVGPPRASSGNASQICVLRRYREGSPVKMFVSNGSGLMRDPHAA